MLILVSYIFFVPSFFKKKKKQILIATKQVFFLKKKQLNYVNYVMHGFVPSQMAYRKAATIQQRSPNSSVYAATSPHSRMGGIAGIPGVNPSPRGYNTAGTSPVHDAYPALYTTNVNIPQSNDEDRQMSIGSDKQALYPKLHHNGHNIHHKNNNNNYYRNDVSPKSGSSGMNTMTHSPPAGTYNDGFAAMKLTVESSRKGTASPTSLVSSPPVHSAANLPHLGFDHCMTIIIVPQSPIPENVKQINAGLHWD
ncbi:hypothetical protein RFI_11561 [Reticulomyxa filosa]|uniref:Uncharacterized protein n=1 Tax=Reticulomyxa filosa TaxID=46433 RepID=X6NJP4_RETFI|nr:hypothetical protein RFI_11561 [Reticulomyxa filosa]|eukprot:ETO25577.1 hypothetical protein RFI_11561 [Reticulomyxa filosa]